MKQYKTVLHRFGSVFFLSLLFGAVLLPAQPKKGIEGEDKTLSPYFFVNSDDPTDKMPLKSTSAEVVISGVIADVEVTQVYKNEGKNTLEAIYIFPGSTRAAVYAMRMTIGERTIEAKIQEKQKARKTYENALKEGKTASLLEQQRPNVFQMNVGNILPGDEITVKLNYTELLVPENAIYEFVYPTVVGPRYSSQTESTAGPQDKWVANPYLEEGKDAPFTFEFSCRINSGISIAKLNSPSHDIKSEYTGKTSVEIKLEKSNKTNKRDVVLQYGLAGDKIESGLLLNIDKKEDFFLLMLEPPKRVATKMIVPREYIFIIDISGSMHGFPLDITKTLMKDLLGNLRPTDFFNVMLFAGSNTVLSEKSLPASKANLEKAINVITRQRGGGGTQLMPALRSAMKLPRAEENISRSMIIVTDGFVSVEKDAFEYISNNLDKGNVFAFGIGSSVNRFLIEGMARAGMGEPFIVLNQQEAPAKAEKLRKYIDSPVLTDIRVNFGGFKTSDVVPVSIPDLFSRKPVVVFGKYSGTPKGTITVTGKTAGKPYKNEIRVSEGKISTENKALRYLWARHKIMRLADYVKMTRDDKRIKEVTQLGLDYNLLTDYTSFVAVDNVKRTEGKPQTTVKQPLPLPDGVSNMAVGATMASPQAPPPPPPAPPPPHPAPMGLQKQMEKKSLRAGRNAHLRVRRPKAEAPPPPSVDEEQEGAADQDSDKRDQLLRKIGELEMKKQAVRSKVAESSKEPLEARYERLHAKKQITVLITFSKTDRTLDTLKLRQVLNSYIKHFQILFYECGQSCQCSTRLTIDASGNVTKVSINKNSCCDDTFMQKLTALLKKLKFENCGTGGGKFTVEFKVKR